MSELAHYFEIVTIGLLFFLALSPLLTAGWEHLREMPGFCPPLSKAIRLPEKGGALGGLLIAAMVAGFIVNQGIDWITDDDRRAGPRTRYESLYECWRLEQPTPALGALAPPATLKILEFEIAKDNEYTRDYLIRHKAAIRMMRAAAFSAAIFMLSMAIYELLRRTRHWTICRYRALHFLAAAVIAVTASLVYASETDDYYKRVFELGTRVNAKAFACTQKGPDMPQLSVR
jgi:hypothetical protein